MSDHMCMNMPTDAITRDQVPWNGVTGSEKLPSIGAETKLDSLEEYHVVLTTEPSLMIVDFQDFVPKYVSRLTENLVCSLRMMLTCPEKTDLRCSVA